MEPELTPEQYLAIVASLWDFWSKKPPVVPPNGNRLFVRWIQLDPDDPSWDDWSLIGLVVDGKVQWTHPEAHADRPDARLMVQQIADGKQHGRIQSDDGRIKIEWGLFTGDGPVESRVSDWATKE